MKKKDFIPQSRRQTRRVQPIYSSKEPVLRQSQNHFDLIKAGVVEGVSSSTGLFDESFGDVPELFLQKQSRLELANALMLRGASAKTASKVASDGVSVEK